MAKKRYFLALALSALLSVLPLGDASAQGIANTLNPTPIAQPWLQTGKIAAGVSVSGTTATTALPTSGNVVWACNTGAADAYISLGSNTVVATTTTSSWLKAGTCWSYTRQIGGSALATSIAAITATGTTTLAVETGIGNPPLSIASSGGGGISSAPYSYSPSSTAGSDQHNLAITASTTLTVPADAVFALVCAKGGSANFRWDGTVPTGTTGQPLLQSQCMRFDGRNIITVVAFIQQTGSTTTLDVAYSK